MKVVNVDQRERNYQERSFNHCKVMVSCSDDNMDIRSIIDKWFMANEIWELKVKSKAWGALTRFTNKIVYAGLVEHFDVPLKNVWFSQKAGCSCGCSPGFIVRGGKRGTWAFLTLEFTEEEVAATLVLIKSKKVAKLLAADMAAHKAAVANNIK